MFQTDLNRISSNTAGVQYYLFYHYELYMYARGGFGAVALSPPARLPCSLLLGACCSTGAESFPAGAAAMRGSSLTRCGRFGHAGHRSHENDKHQTC